MYHFIGIAGSGMSSLALIMYNLGFKVKGSDISKDFFTTEELKKVIKIADFDEKNITKDLIIVQGNAFNDDNVEVKKAKELGLKIYSYQDMVAKLTEMFETISISGCHGKTTTTAMLSHVLKNIRGTNYLIGDGTGYARKGNKTFVLEACEYKRHFLAYQQKYAIITNIDLDHIDYYKDINDVIDAYQDFALNTDKYIIAYGDDPYTRKLKINKILFYGLKGNNDVIAKKIKYDSTGTIFDVYINKEYYDTFFIKFTGEHMVLNAMAVISLCYLEKIEKDKVKHELSTFLGAKRRFSEEKINNNIIIDDYAHHPKEIEVTIKAAKLKYPNKKLITIFQPHTFSRTKKFINEFIKVLNESDITYVLDVHPSREKQEDFPNINSEIIISKLNKGFCINKNNADELLKYDNVVLLFLSPNSLKDLIDDYKNKINS
ncbi:MAG: UDP-N-acetylmuramate--L-alanine ligase [Bacilli bacterium]|nr:UDP-N-acetylmuramate--L-alanine ligase [Bacilli bacterium]MDD4406419.1 UDP-N-acetylmuramate--L-alanine ligase [Bacilli bacterium]